MRCNICNSKLDRIKEDKTARGGYAPCSKCEQIVFDTNQDQDRLYDDTDPAIDIAAIMDRIIE